jgi:hypothetical protein
MTGEIVDGLTIAVGSLGPALATVLVTWLKTRVGRVRLRVTRPDGVTVEMDAEQVRGLDAEGSWLRVGQVADLLNAAPQPQPQPRGTVAGTTAGGGDGNPPTDGGGERVVSAG